MVTLILGGARSGKSSFAEKLAQKKGGDEVYYLATAEAKDKEMKKRIEKHKEQRNKKWKTIEEPLSVGEVLSQISKGEVVLIDCITVYISNLLFSNLEEINKNIKFEDKEKLIIKKIEKIVTTSKNKEVILVSNEVGMGIVPGNKMGREYRDIAGRVNQFLAQKADKVYITIAGLPVELKEITAKLDV